MVKLKVDRSLRFGRVIYGCKREEDWVLMEVGLVGDMFFEFFGWFFGIVGL